MKPTECALSEVDGMGGGERRGGEGWGGEGRGEEGWEGRGGEKFPMSYGDLSPHQ